VSEITKNSENFVVYECKDITVRRDMESLYADSYPSFGWTLEGTGAHVLGLSSVMLKFKRDRKTRNKAELTRLQRQFESIVGEIERLENSKTIGASIVAFTVGIVGTAFLAGSVFAITATPQNIPLCIILGVPGFIGWALPYFLYTRILKKRIDTVTPLIDGQYDAIYEVCERAGALLRN
jgi:hypothetical protein